ncbi:hypothetical protein ACPPVT_12175 [Angustibacter sp. McL0619]|uniref:hypothetical protein n=1 Tax=Angustibacter sp. McL0619 TaxID=3415676 RepID=UPI003CF378D7
MTTQDEQVPDGVPEADYVEQHTFADGTDDEGDLVPDLDREDDADVADLQDQSTPAPVDDDERR